MKTVRSQERELLQTLKSGEDLQLESRTINKLLTLNKSFEFSSDRWVHRRHIQYKLSHRLKQFMCKNSSRFLYVVCCKVGRTWR